MSLLVLRWYSKVIVLYSLKFLILLLGYYVYISMCGFSTEGMGAEVLHILFKETCNSGCCETYSFLTDGYGIFNVRTHLGACLFGCVSYTRRWGVGGGGRGGQKHVCTRVDSKEQKKKPTVPRYNCHGWLGVKNQLFIYLSCPAMISNSDSSHLTSGALPRFI